jgi:hypothetical protein
MGARTTADETTTCKIHTIDYTTEIHKSEFCDPVRCQQEREGRVQKRTGGRKLGPLSF